MNAYYYTEMTKPQQTAYYAIKNGLISLAPSFQIPKMENREVGDLFFKLRLDCPEIFWGTGFQIRFYRDSANMEMIPEYLFEKGKIKEHQKAMEKRVEKVAKSVAGSTQYETLLGIHDFICSQVFYDKLKKPYSHEIIGPLGHGVGVCEGIAKTVKILCDSLGIWSVIAISDANPQKGIKYRHAWNVVRLNGKYYHMDATFDNTLSHQQEIRYDYVNLSDKQIFCDHEPLLYEVPGCEDGSQTYYQGKKLSFTKMEDVEKRVKQAVKKGKPLTFHWRGGFLNRDLLTGLLTVVETAAKEKEKTAKVTLNRTQAVFQVEIKAPIPGAVLEFQDTPPSAQ